MKHAAPFALLTMVCALAAPGFAHAQSGGLGGTMRGFIERGDSNGDGQLTRAEAEAGLQARFKALDTDSDGKVTRTEMSARRQASLAAWREKQGLAPVEGTGKRHGSSDAGRREARLFKRLDRDGDGAISFNEMKAVDERLFTAMDANADAIVTMSEAEAARSRMAQASMERED